MRIASALLSNIPPFSCFACCFAGPIVLPYCMAGSVLFKTFWIPGADERHIDEGYNMSPAAMGEHRMFYQLLGGAFNFRLITEALVGQYISSAKHLPSRGSGRALYGFSSKGASSSNKPRLTTLAIRRKLRME